MTQTLSEIVTLVLAPEPDEHPLSDATQEQIERGRGLPPKDMTPEERHEYRLQQQRRRARSYRKRQAAKTEAEAKERTTTLGDGQLREALDVTSLLSRIIDDVATRRARKAGRLLGNMAEDSTFETFAAVNRSIAGAITRGEREKGDLLTAAEWLSQQPGIPDLRHEEPPEHAGWLMAVIEYRSKSAIQEWYAKEPSIESLAHGDSAIDSTWEDDYYDRFVADAKPAPLGARWPQPGEADLGIVQAVIAGAITARGLDPLVELILANTRSDGLFSWSEHAEGVFRALGLCGHWEVLCRKVESRELRGRYAKGAARRALAFILPAMEQATKMLERGSWSPPDPERLAIRQTLAPDPDQRARHIIEALGRVAEAFAGQEA